MITDAWWKEERGERVFVDFNQNAPHKTVFGAWSARSRPGGQVSTPFFWDELDTIDPDSSTIATVPARVASGGDPWAEIDVHPQSLQPLLDMYEKDLASGLQDAPWPPVYPKMPGEPPRVAPSREEAGTGRAGRRSGRQPGEEGHEEGHAREEGGEGQEGPEAGDLTRRPIVARPGAGTFASFGDAPGPFTLDVGRSTSERGRRCRLK